METKDLDLLTAARAAALRAYAPYSRFRVGAALRLDDGTVVCGNNQENIAYPLGSCAERVAVNYARATYPERRIEAIAVVSPDSPTPVTPCGGCRQLLAEAVRAQGGADIRVVMGSSDEAATHLSCVSELLPYAFEFISE